MGTRRFTSIEEKDSRVKWEKADVLTAEKLKAAIKSRQIYTLRSVRGSGVSSIFLVFPVLLLLFYFFVIAETQPFYVHIIVVSALSIFFFGYLIRFIKHPPRPSFNFKNRDIWIKRAKCNDLFISGTGSDKKYLAAFQMGTVHVCLRMRLFQYQVNPVGEEYIFFKFNKQYGNTWEAVSAVDVEKFAVLKPPES